MKSKTLILIYLIVFALFDTVIPIPFAAILLIYVLLEKPKWFKELVNDIYQS
jgi:hypothetical protein